MTNNKIKKIMRTREHRCGKFYKEVDVYGYFTGLNLSTCQASANEETERRESSLKQKKINAKNASRKLSQIVAANFTPNGIALHPTYADENLPLTEGTERLFRTLKKYGFKTAILSGGFTYFGKYLQNKLGIDYVFANQLEIVDGKLTGNYLGDIVDGPKKAELLRNNAFKEEIHLEQTVAVGDGSNVLPMLNIAGLGIAYHAKPLVKENAQHAISTTGLDAILYLMGFRERDIE